MPQAQIDLDVIKATIAEGAGRDFSAVADHLRGTRLLDERHTEVDATER